MSSERKPDSWEVHLLSLQMLPYKAHSAEVLLQASWEEEAAFYLGIGSRCKNPRGLRPEPEEPPSLKCPNLSIDRKSLDARLVVPTALRSGYELLEKYFFAVGSWLRHPHLRANWSGSFSTPGKSCPVLHRCQTLLIVL